jgi:hypothetical protein
MPVNTLKRHLDEIDKLSWPEHVKAELKALVSIEYLSGYADGYMRGKAAAMAEETLAALAGN